MIFTDLHKQHGFAADLKIIEQFNLIRTPDLNEGATSIFVIYEFKETILNFSSNSLKKD